MISICDTLALKDFSQSWDFVCVGYEVNERFLRGDFFLTIKYIYICINRYGLR